MSEGLTFLFDTCEVAAVRFSSVAGRVVSPFSGGHSEGETPLPIPNRAVKPLSADGTWPFRPGRVGRRRFFFKGRPTGRPFLLPEPFDPPHRRAVPRSAGGGSRNRTAGVAEAPGVPGPLATARSRSASGSSASGSRVSGSRAGRVPGVYDAVALERRECDGGVEGPDEAALRRRMGGLGIFVTEHMFVRYGWVRTTPPGRVDSPPEPVNTASMLKSGLQTGRSRSIAAP